MRGLIQMQRRGVIYNATVMLALQAGAAVGAICLDALGFTEATVVIVFVLSVLLTAVFTTEVSYCLAAAILSILSFNYFLVTPRFSFRIQGADVPGTMAVMFVVALVASYLVMRVRASDQKYADAQLVAQNEQLRSDLLRSVSHDLRTPLTAISGNADILLDEDADLGDEQRRLLLQGIYDDATWLNAVVENLLTVTRLEDGYVALHKEVESVDEVVEGALSHISSDARKHTIVFTPSAEILLARMDARVMVQVVVNLVNNAIAHTQEGSHIDVFVWRDNDKAAVSVADDGPGISSEDLPHIFDTFYTTSKLVADGRRGFGLGLPLCKSIVEAHDGELRFDAAKPHGAVFTFTLPLEEVPAHE